MRSRRKKKKKVAAVEYQLELDNKNKALLTRPQSEVADDKYNEFYKALINDYEKHLAVKQFRTECGVGFTVLLLFVSKRALYDLFEPKTKFKKSNFMFDVFSHEQLK
jgi:molecular chaperone HtpG